MTVVQVLRPAALAGLADRHAVVEASAGTGKTYVLEHLVIELLLRRQLELEQILVVTFTEKAAAELVQRVRAKLGQLRDLGPEDPLAIAGAAAPAEQCWILDEAARRRLGSALLAFDRASITTIHGFCQGLLREHAFLHDRLFDEELADEEDLFHAAFVESLRRDAAADPAVAPYLAAWLASGKGLDRLERKLLLACHRHGVRGEVERRPPPLDEAALAAALAAFPAVEGDDALLAAELKRHRVHASSIKALLARLTWLSHVARAGRPAPAFLVELEANAASDDDLLPWVCHRLRTVPDDDSRAGRLATAVRTLAAQVVPLGAELVHRILPRLAARLEEHKRERGLYDFQDMLGLVARALGGDGPRARALMRTLRARYRHALIDEFQDTDEVQWSIFRRVFLDSPEGHRMTVIGDPKQAIYGFRGADVHTYQRARGEILTLAGTPADYLTESFRSTAPLTAAVNALLDQQAPNPFFRRTGGIRYDHPVTCGRPELALIDADGSPAPPVVVLDVQAPQSEATLYTWQVKQALLGRIVEETAALLSPSGPRWRGRPLRAGDLYVLTRTTRESREVGDALREAGLPFAFFKQERLFATVEARELLDLLRAIADPGDPTARARAFITGFFGLSLPELTACEDLPPGHPLARLLAEWNALAEAGAFEELFARIVGDSGIVCRELFAGTGERRLTNHLHLLEVLQHEASHRRATLRELIQTLAAYINGDRRPPGHQSDIQRLETDADAIQVMTIHHAKGLEAPVVFVYGAFWPGPRGDVRLFHDDAGQPVVRVGRAPPDEEARLADEQDDEERRVLYVALTRARGRLYLPHHPPVFKALRGSYRFVNERLRELLGGFTPLEVRRLFAHRPVPCPAPPPVLRAPAAEALAAWSPPPELLAGDAEIDADIDGLVALGEARSGLWVTSYSAVMRRQGTAAPAAADEDAETAAVAPPLPPDELPRGRISGAFLHECLEEIPLDGPGELERWAARADVAALFERLRRRHDRDPAHLPHARRLVHTALTAPVRLGDARIAGLGTAARAVREMEFLYPIVFDPDGRGSDAHGAEVRRGVVRGYIDLLLEHEGRAYVCDWKGDWLASWDPQVVAAHCQRHYQVQARLYTVAALRLLGIADRAAYEGRFGGILYGFVRGMRGDDERAGIHFRCPPWEEVERWQRDMLDDAFWRLG